MLLFGHPGITLGITAGLAQALSMTRLGKVALSTSPEQSSRQDDSAAVDTSQKLPPWLDLTRCYIDLRILLVASLLPDIIDKPVGQYFFRDTFSNGRIFSHTLVFLLALIISGLIIFRSYRQTWMLVLAFGTLTHLVLDRMWSNLPVLLWPTYGYAFPRADISNWAQNILHALVANPLVALPETVGGIVLIWFVTQLIRAKSVSAFLKNKYPN